MHSLRDNHNQRLRSDTQDVSDNTSIDLNERDNEEHNINPTVSIYNNDNANLNVAFPNGSDNINQDVDTNL